MFLSRSIRLQWANKILVTSAKIIGADVLFMILGKSFTHKRKSRGGVKSWHGLRGYRDADM